MTNTAQAMTHRTVREETTMKSSFVEFFSPALRMRCIREVENREILPPVIVTMSPYIEAAEQS